jgi:hypothetical protein
VLARHGLTLRTDVLADEARSLYADALSPAAPARDGAGTPASTSDVLRETDEVLDRLGAVLERVRAQQTA